ncbi:MAG: hypothetical protein JXQ99_16495 [Hyphomicrobiaceae bacterium]
MFRSMHDHPLPLTCVRCRAALRLLVQMLALCLAWTLSAALPAAAQSGWSTGTQAAPTTPGTPGTAQGTSGTPSTPGSPGSSLTTTVLPRQPAAIPAQSGVLSLSAFLTADGSQLSRRAIDRGLVWRIYTIERPSEPAKLLVTRRESKPTFEIPAGKYAINAAFGRAHLTQIIDVRGGTRQRETFVLNAGGLRVITRVAGGGIAKDTARYDIFSDERDQSGNRLRVISNARPGRITRLNSGIYHIVSRLGDANASVSAEVAVEAGKLTEAVVSHEAAKVTFKLVKTESGEAHADTQWVIMTKTGDIIKETAGALPTHVLAPGSYNVIASRAGENYTGAFTVESGKNVEIEIMMR